MPSSIEVTPIATRTVAAVNAITSPLLYRGGVAAATSTPPPAVIPDGMTAVAGGDGGAAAPRSQVSSSASKTSALGRLFGGLRLLLGLFRKS